MKIVKKSEAMKILKSNTGSKIVKFCTGKYKWEGSQKTHIGREVVDNQDVLAVYVERRQDSDGPYAQMQCVSAV